MSFIWGPLADRFGRARCLAATIVMFSVFTGAAAFSENVWQLGLIPFPGRDRHRRGMGDGGHLCRRILAGGSPQARRRLSADRLLCRLLPGRGVELHGGSGVRLAGDVSLRRSPPAGQPVHPGACPRTGALDASQGKAGDQPASRDFLRSLSAPYRGEHRTGFGRDHRSVGGNSL